MALVLFDDERARAWTPFSVTRPAGELLFGCLTLRDRAERFWGEKCVGHITDPELEGFAETGSAPVLDAAAWDSVIGSATGTPQILFSSRAIPDFTPAPPVHEAAVLTIQGETVGWVLPEGTDPPDGSDLLRPDDSAVDFPRVEIPGRVLSNFWDLMAGNAEQVCLDVPVLFPESRFTLADGVHVSGAERVSLGEGVDLEAAVHLDATDGPIRLSDGVRISAFTRVAGPAFVGPETRLLGGSLGHITIGPTCRVRGEVSNSVLLGYVNKSHEGYLGHAYVGSWVNLGALTTNSDLKNNYGRVRVHTAEGPVDTGLIKVGCFLGDHVKTGIGTLLPTGCVVGAGSNLFGGLLTPTHVPPFSWGSGVRFEEYEIDRFLETAALAMSRREVPLEDGGRTLLQRAWERTRPERELGDRE
jgi:UDP-N-acetylglucosamine diphosphorylase/glucosamine-1-phosphate N-acetyltransferase